MQTILRILIGATVVLVLAFVIWANDTSSPTFFVGSSEPISSSTPRSEETGATTEPTSSVEENVLSTPFKNATTTLFFIGEKADASNDFIPNGESYWDEHWQTHFGGIDAPAERCGFNPCGFTPLENPFYVALPYAEFDSAGNLKPSAQNVPWYSMSSTPLLKNRWVEIVHNGHICYGQWEDVGPNGEDDFGYVFGSSATPTNTFGERAGLDVSPALWKCLGMEDNDITSWRFVGASDVEEGPWKDTVTSSDTSWGN